MLDQYQNGDHIGVWNTLRSFEEAVRSKDIYPDALAVSRATMTRVRYNIETLVDRLRVAGYQFQDDSEAHLAPTQRDLEMLSEIDTKFGPLPLSFRVFHEIVGSVNFCQSLQQLVQYHRPKRKSASEVETLGEQDPLFVRPVQLLYGELMTDPGLWREPNRKARYNWRNDRENCWYYCFAPDEFHKANYSGGENYNLYFPDPCADFQIFDLFPSGEENGREWFVDYLRNTFKGGGFRGGYQDNGTLDPVKKIPHSMLIDQLCEGLMEI